MKNRRRTSIKSLLFSPRPCRNRRGIMFFFLLTGLIVTPLFSNENHLNCFLLTVGPGEELYTWFGHTGIIIENDKGEGRFYDFGNFSFKSDHFYRNFAMGRLMYMKIAVPSRGYVNYITSKGQRVNLQKLRLSQEKIRQMQQELEENTRKGHNTYLYHHYLDNCATRPRDILDKAMDGALKEHTARKTENSFRNSFRRYSGSHFFADTLLSFLQGRNIDRKITRWETLFLPDELMNALNTMDSPLGGPLVEQNILLAEASPERSRPFEKAPSNALKALLTGLLAGAFLLFLQLRSEASEKGAKLSEILFFIIMLSLSFLGLVFYFLSFISNHVVAHWNINVLIVHPFYLIPGLMMLAGRKAGLPLFWQIQGAAALFMAGLNVLFFHQDNLRISLIMLPLILIPAIPGLNPEIIKGSSRGHPKYTSMYNPTEAG